MKIKKASVFSLVLALALIAAVTTGFATSAADATEQDNLDLVQMEFDNSKTFEKSINLADNDAAGGLVQISGSQTYDEHQTLNINDLNKCDATDILKNAQPMKITLLSVSHNDEHKFTQDEWAQILELIEQGEICWED